MTDGCMGCRVPGYSHAAYCPEGRVEDLRSRLAEAEELLAEAERDRDAGWKAFYALRDQVGKDRYPGLTNVVRATDSAASREDDSHD